MVKVLKKLYHRKLKKLKSQLDKASSAFEKEKLQDRLDKLVGGVAIINVGGNSEIEIKEKKDRVEDALFATKSCFRRRYYSWRWCCFIAASKRLKSFISKNPDIMIGKNIVEQAIQEPFVKILTNAGHEENNVRFASYNLLNAKNNTWKGLDYKDLTIVNFKELGIIDPKKVTRVALENAASIAGTILTTESVIYEKREDKVETPNPMAGMM